MPDKTVFLIGVLVGSAGTAVVLWISTLILLGVKL